MKKILITLTLVLIVMQPLFCQDTLIFTEKYKAYMHKLAAIKSNLVYIDSAKLLSTFSTDEGIKEFIQIHKDSSDFTFISTFSFEFINEHLVLKKNKFDLNPYESAFYNYVKNRFINFKFKEKRRTNNKYQIVTDWMFDSDEKQIVIKIMDFTKNQHVILFKATIPYKESSDISLFSQQKNH